MKVTYLPNVEQWPEGKARIEQITGRLEEILGRSAALVTVEWQRVQDHRGRLLYRLTLKDFTGQVTTDFAPDELENRAYMQVRLARLWDDLLRIRSNVVHAQALAINGQIAGDPENEQALP